MMIHVVYTVKSFPSTELAHLSPHVGTFFTRVRPFNSYSLKKCQLYNTIFTTIVTMLY